MPFFFLPCMNYVNTCISLVAQEILMLVQCTHLGFSTRVMDLNHFSCKIAFYLITKTPLLTYLTIIQRTWLCVCVFVVELLLHFYPDRNQIWTPDRYGRGTFNEGAICKPLSIFSKNCKKKNGPVASILAGC